MVTWNGNLLGGIDYLSDQLSDNLYTYNFHLVEVAPESITTTKLGSANQQPINVWLKYDGRPPTLL